MPEEVKDIKVLLKEMSEAIEEREQVIAEAKRIRDVAIETGAICQRYASEPAEELKETLSGISGNIDEIDEIIKTYTEELDRLKELERISEAFRHFGLPATLTRRSE